MTHSKNLKIEGTGEVYNKSKNAEGEFFIKMPSNLMNYVHVPGYKPEYNYLYAIIVDFYNVEQGYAYPNEWQLSRKYGKGTRTVREHINALVRFGLIKKFKRGLNNCYVPLQPLSQEKLFKVCPEAERKYKDEIEKEAEEFKRWELQKDSLR